ncbi:MAG: helix-hairpin-helix domain-containing protein [Bacteroidota bacterium]|nr:helix-hairpin-helix domain-containing protein [Bacteroidota bacterium]
MDQKPENNISKSRIRGLFVLAFIILVCLFIQYTIRYWAPNPDIYLHEIKEKTKDEKSDSQLNNKPANFSFNPNVISYDSLLLLGLSVRQAEQWVKYRVKGGKFYKAEDVKRLYAIDSSTYLRLLPNLTLPNQNGKDAFVSKKLVAIDINSADSIQFISLPGIGPVYAGKILRFRKNLGGFANITQVAETYGVEMSQFELARPYMRLVKPIKKLVVNETNYESLNLHPYISSQQANAIINFRKNQHPITGIADLKSMKVFSDEEIEKLLPYLSFDISK